MKKDDYKELKETVERLKKEKSKLEEIKKEKVHGKKKSRFGFFRRRKNEKKKAIEYNDEIEKLKKEIEKKKEIRDEKKKEEEKTEKKPPETKKTEERKEIVKKKQTPQIRHDITKTPIDDLFDFVNKVNKVKISAAARKFNVNKFQIEEWAKILEEHDMVRIHYPIVGEAEIRKK